MRIERLEGRQLLAADGSPFQFPSSAALRPEANVFAVPDDPLANRPTVSATRPANGATNQPRNIFVGADVIIRNSGHGVDPATLTPANVKLVRTRDGVQVATNANTSGGGDAIMLAPVGLLEANTEYRFIVTDDVKDTAGARFVASSTTFTTGTQTGNTLDGSVSFTRTGVATGHEFTGITIGPDNRLYAGTFDGKIIRYSIGSDGSLSSPLTINTVPANNGGPRTIIGIRFAPGSTASNLVLWVSHGQFAEEGASDFTGKISKLSGSTLGTYQDVVTGLPRSVRDHLTNQIDFGPDGALYVTQGSNSSMGSPDIAWGQRPERLLTAAVLRVDVSKISSPLNVATGSSGNYNPFAAGAPVTLYATGVRNAFDLVWHSNGKLYTTVNGAAAGGSTPGFNGGTAATRIDQAVNGPYTGPNVPGLNNIPETQDDFLYRITKGGYYGHPNPTRGEYVLNGGNPTHGADPQEITSYPVGTQPDRNYRQPAFRFGKSYSPDGLIEYRSNAFGGLLKGRLLVARYSGGDDVMILQPDGNGNIIRSDAGVQGLTNLQDPLDLVEDRRNGNLYIVEYGAQRISLARPATTTGNPGTPGAGPAKLEVIAPGPQPRALFADPAGSAQGPDRRITLRNAGAEPLTISRLQITAGNSSHFSISSAPATPFTLTGGASIDVKVRFKDNGMPVGTVRDSLLRVTSNSQGAPLTDVLLRGLVTRGASASLEPSLQWVMDLYRNPILVGDNDPGNPGLPNPLAGPNDQLETSHFIKAGDGPITVEPIASFTGSAKPVVRFGLYSPGTPQLRQEAFTINATDFQTLHPQVEGSTSFEPLIGGAFGLYTSWPGVMNREVYSEDVLNTFDPDAGNRRKMRTYLLRNPDGSVAPNAYVVAFEELTGAGDFQDFVAIVRNVRPADPGRGEIGVETLDGPYHNRLTFNRIENPQPATTTHDVAFVRVRNTGSGMLDISRMAIDGPFRIESAQQFSLAPGAATDVRIRFLGNQPGVSGGAVYFVTNDPDEQVVGVELAGVWQPQTIGGPEPSLQQVLPALGLETAIAFDDQTLNRGGKRETVGEEVLSAYWQSADTSKPVVVRQIASFHAPGNQPTAFWHMKGTNAPTPLFTQSAVDLQSVFPRKNGTSEPAAGMFDPGAGTFGFRVDSEWSDNTKNRQEQTGGNFGHHIRFFPAEDRSGRPITDTWIMAMTYPGGDYSYNDAVYLITNVRPESAPSAVPGLAGFSVPRGVQLDWAPTTSRYNIFRSTTANGVYTRLNENTITTSDYLDATAVVGATYHYRVVALNSSGMQSAASAVVVRKT